MNNWVDYAINSQNGIVNLSRYINNFEEILLEVFKQQVFKLLVGNVKCLGWMPAPMNCVLIDRNINNVLDVFLNNLTIQLFVFLEDILDWTKDFKNLGPL